MKNRKYHTVRTVPKSIEKYHTVRTVPKSIEKYHTVRTVPKSNREIVERGKMDTSNDSLFSWLGTGTSIKSGRVKLLYSNTKITYRKQCLHFHSF